MAHSINGNFTTEMIGEAHASATSLYVTLVIDTIGILLSSIAIVCMVTIKELDSIFTGTLLSHSIANVVGGLFFLFSTITEMLHVVIKGINPPTVISMAVSIMLSIAHLLCLVLAEYIQISGRFRYVTKSFRPVLVIVWFLVFCSCSVLFFLDRKTTEMISFTIIIISWLGIIAFYTSIMKYYRNHQSRIVQYSISNIRDPVVGKDIIFPRVILAVYFFCTLPWAFKEAHYVKNNLSVYDSVSYYLITVYSLNFHVVSLTCVYLRCRNNEKNATYTRHYASSRNHPEANNNNSSDNNDKLGEYNTGFDIELNEKEV